MHLKISDIINKHKGSVAVIDLFGRSGNDNRVAIDGMAKRGEIVRFSCNNWFDFFPGSPAPNYWVLASNMDTIAKYKGQINKHMITLVIASTPLLTILSQIPRPL